MAAEDPQQVEADRRSWQRKVGVILSMCDDARSRAPEGEAKQELQRLYDRMCEAINTGAFGRVTDDAAEAQTSYMDMVELFVASGTAIPVPTEDLYLTVVPGEPHATLYATVNGKRKLVGACTIEDDA
jgi:hypothetical protein